MLKFVNGSNWQCISIQDDWSEVEKSHVWELHNASYDTSGMYTCEVMVPSLPELREQKSVQIIVRGGFVCGSGFAY